MATLLVGNLLRRLKEFPMYKVDTRTAAELLYIEEAFSRLLPYLHNAEWDPQDDEQGRSNVSFGVTESRNSTTWPWIVAALAADVEETVISYNFHLLNMNTGTLYSKFLYSCSFMLDSTNEGRNYLSNHYQSIRASKMIQVFCPIDRSSAAGCILLLRKVPERLNTLAIEMWKHQKMTTSPQLQPVQKNLGSALMVDRAKEVKLLEGQLLAKKEGDPNIITILGEAGIGKTTVAEAVYEQVQKHFDCHAWVFVSTDDSTGRIMQNILRGILKSISVMAPNNIDTMGEKPLKKLIHSWLIGKKFLLILDDVPSWEIVQEVKDTIRGGHKTGKILVTSRLRAIGSLHSRFNLSPIYSTDLLHEHACSLKRHEEFFSSVQSAAEGIAKQCGGLPLAMVTVGRMLSTKHMVKDWDIVHQMLQKGASFMRLCYADLSPALQSCFLYAALFPCHFEISCKKLKRLWIAEGFVQHNKNTTLEESAQLQLEELIHKNMIQVVKRNIDGEVKTCRILRMMRDFALRRSEDVGFSVILNNLKSNLPEKCHRAFLYGATSNDGSSTSKFSREDFSRLYSFIALEESQHQPLNLNDFKLLSVLELQGFCHELLPDGLGDLALLRYLGLRGGKIKKLPASLKKLGRLQTLDIRDTMVRDFPDDLQGLGDLRHLLLEGSFTDKVVNLRDGIIEAFKDLQTLCGLKMTERIAEGLIDLRGIRKLSVGEIQGSHLVPLFGIPQILYHERFFRGSK